MFCSRCGKEIDNNIIYCPNCGTKVNDSPICDEETRSGKAHASLVIGIVCLLAWLVPIIGVPLAIVGLVFGIISVKTADKRAVIGIILCIISLIASVANAAVGAYMGYHGLLGFQQEQSQTEMVKEENDKAAEEENTTEAQISLEEQVSSEDKIREYIKSCTYIDSDALSNLLRYPEKYENNNFAFIATDPLNFSHLFKSVVDDEVFQMNMDGIWGKAIYYIDKRNYDKTRILGSDKIVFYGRYCGLVEGMPLFEMYAADIVGTVTMPGSILDQLQKENVEEVQNFINAVENYSEDQDSDVTQDQRANITKETSNIADGSQATYVSNSVITTIDDLGVYAGDPSNAGKTFQIKCTVRKIWPDYYELYMAETNRYISIIGHGLIDNSNVKEWDEVLFVGSLCPDSVDEEVVEFDTVSIELP